MGLGALLERALRGILPARSPSVAELFRRADRLRHEGRIGEAADLVEEGLRRVPSSTAGHLLAGYLRLAAREVERARVAFQSVLALDPDHPRALLGLARIAIEEGDPAAARPYLERALQYHADFPEARALEDMLASWTPEREDAASAGTTRDAAAAGIHLPAGGRDAILARLDGAVVLARCDEGREAALAQHVIRVARIATATLTRAGLGALRRGVIEGAHESTYLQTGVGLVLAVSLPAGMAVGDGLAELARLWGDKAHAVETHD